jgi:8-oxo-dGTP pyrophosphatase MutT (NUDIX family)
MRFWIEWRTMSKHIAEYTDESFGVIAVHENGDALRFLIIQHNAGHWAFPKGHAERDETAKEAALREFREETGVKDVTLFDDRIFEERYTKTLRGNAKKLVRKTVQYYIGRVENARVKVQPEEIQDYRWATLDEARKLITYSESRRLLEEAATYIATM